MQNETKENILEDIRRFCGHHTWANYLGNLIEGQLMDLSVDQLKLIRVVAENANMTGKGY
jgi:hypothetical protein